MGPLKMNSQLKGFAISVNESKIEIEFRDFFFFCNLQIRCPIGIVKSFKD